MESDIGDGMLRLGVPYVFMGFGEVQLEVGPCLGVGVFVVPFSNVNGNVFCIGNSDEANVDGFFRHGRCSG